MVSIQLGSEQLFTFGVGFPDINLNDPNMTYFDFLLVQLEVAYGSTIINETVVPVEQCTANHFHFSSLNVSY